MAKPDGTYPLIPAVAGLTEQVLTTLAPTYQKQIDGLKGELARHDIETILSRVRSLSQVIGSAKVHDLDGPGFATFGTAICSEIGKIVDVRLPTTRSAYADLVNWISGTTRDYPVEIFTTNYDLLFEEALEFLFEHLISTASRAVANLSSTQFQCRAAIFPHDGRGCGNSTVRWAGAPARREK